MKIDEHQYPKWIWHSKIREMTWALFRREFDLSGDEVEEASGIVSANTRYNLYVNGTLVRRGPAPFDPRLQESYPVELKPYLKEGKNVIGALVCYFGRPMRAFEESSTTDRHVELESTCDRPTALPTGLL